MAALYYLSYFITIKTDLNLPYLSLPNKSVIPFPNPAGSNLFQPQTNYVFLVQEMPDDLFKIYQNLTKCNSGPPARVH